MKKREYQHQNIQQAIDATFSGVTMSQQMQYRVLREVKGETKVKKRLSLGLVLAIVLVLITVTALATVYLSGYFTEYGRIESEFGTYEQWPTVAKTELVRAMQKSGMNIDQVKTQKLLDGTLDVTDQEELATEIISEYFGGTDYMNTYNIMEHELGAFGGEGWSQEDLALYSQMVEQYGIGSADGPIYVVPQADVDITREQAIEIARATLMQTYNITEQILEMYKLEECTFAIFRNSETPYWFAWFLGYDLEEYSNNSYSVSIARDGQILETTSPKLKNPINAEFDELEKERGKFVTWSIEEKASFYHIWPSKIDQWYEEGNVETQGHIKRYIFYLAGKAFMLPGENDISEKDALEKAQYAFLQQYHLDAKALDDYTYLKSFLLDSNSATLISEQRAMWRWFFVPKVLEGGDYGYRVDIDAKTGELIAIVHQNSDEVNYWASDYE